MDPIHAAQVVNAMYSKPGWTLRAKPTYGGIILTITLDGKDSSDWRRGYAKPVHQSIDRFVDTTRMYADKDLVSAVIRLMIGYELHEWTEFARLPDGTAPFHPHTGDGQYNTAMDHGLRSLYVAVQEA